MAKRKTATAKSKSGAKPKAKSKPAKAKHAKRKSSRGKVRLQVRQLTPEDYPGVCRIQDRSFAHLEPWTEAQFRHLIEIFPEGQIGVEMDGRLVATSNSLIMPAGIVRKPHSFSEICANLFAVHDDDGDHLYGIDIAVDPEFRGKRLARRLYDARKELLEERNLRSFVIAGRMPNYAKHAKKMKPAKYLRQVLEQKIRDPVIAAQTANGFAIHGVIEGYLPGDLDSGGNAVLMEWINPSYLPANKHHGAYGTVRVVAVQYQMRAIDNFDQFRQQCEFFVDTAADYRADFVVFPELLTNQLLCLVPSKETAKAARELSQYTDAYIAYFSQAAIDHDINIIAGSHLTLEGDTLYNIAYLFHRDGRIDRQRKIHITPAESRWWGVTGGERIHTFDTDCGKIAILICYDSEFPELARITTEMGAHILFVPYNTDIRSAWMRVRTCTGARCIENNVYAVMSGACGNLPLVEGSDIHYAQSVILSPSDIAFSRDGICAEATPNVETMLVHDLDLDVLRRMESEGAVRTWLDRRSDMYQVSWNDEGEQRHI